MKREGTDNRAKKNKVCTYLSDEDNKELEALAERMGITLSSLIRMAVKEYLHKGVKRNGNGKSKQKKGRGGH